MKHATHHRPPTRTLLSCALASCLVLIAPAAFAQSAAGSLRGQVSTSTGPAASATITATNLGNGTTRSVTAGDTGNYTLAGLPPGTYRVDVSVGGATTSRTVVVQVGQQATLDLAVGPTAADDTTTLGTVEVSAASMVETRNSEVATYITPNQIAALPQVNRNFLAYADIVPGVQFTTAGDGSTQLRSGAQGASAINVFIDGVSQKAYTLPGGISGQDSSRGNPFPQSAIGEYKIITQNYKAEFDQIGSAAVVAATRAGSNEFHGELFYDRFTDGMRERTYFEERDDLPKTEQLDEQYGVSFGGPILRDRLHYFVAYEGKQIVSPRDIIPGQGFPTASLPAEVQSLVGPTTSPFQENLYFGRLDFAASDNSYFDFTFKYRDETELTGIGGVSTASYGTDKTNEETRAALRWQFSTDTWLNDAQLTFEDLSWSPRAAGGDIGTVLTVGGDPGRVILQYGGGRDFQDKGQRGWGFQDDFSLTSLEWNGYHLVKFGFKYKDVDVHAREQNPYNPQYYYDVFESYTVPYQVQLGVPLAGVGDGSAESSNTQFGIYIQDDWEVNEHLTLNLGVRWDYEKSPTYTDFETPADVAAALRGWANLQNADYDIEDYISDGSQRDAFTTGIQPRLGFSYDFNGDERTVLFGGIGRSYDRNLFDRLQLEQTKATFPSQTLRFNTPMHPCAISPTCLAWNPSYLDPDVIRALVATSGAGREINLINNDLDMPYSDQASLGIRHRLADWNLEASVSHVESHDGFIFLMGNRRPDGSFFAPGTTWGAPWGFSPPGFGPLILGTNGLETRADSLYLKADKPYTRESGWGVTAAYTYTDAEENRQFGEHYSLDYPTIDGFGWRQAGGVPEHRLVLTGVWDGWWGITFSGKYQIASAAPRYGLNCAEFGFNDCHPDTVVPDGVGFQQLDLAAYKEWPISSDGDIRLRARFDVLNVTDERNWSGYDTWWGGPGSPNPNLGVRDGSLAGPTRTLKVSLGLIW